MVCYRNLLQFDLYYIKGPKGEGTGDSQDEDVAEEEEEIGHVDDGEDDDMDDEPQTGVLSSGVDEHWTVSNLNLKLCSPTTFRLNELVLGYFLIHLLCFPITGRGRR